MRIFWRFLIAFLAITGLAALATGVFGVQLGQLDYWNYHGVLFLIGITLFPRVTLLFSSVPSGGLLWWVSWLFAPRLLVAVLATLVYWHHNPLLVVIAWWAAVGGESSEKYVMIRRSHSRWRAKRGFEDAKWVDVGR